MSVKIAEDGEILTKGPNLMLGYYKEPELTNEAIDKDGWFYTGDIGEFVEGDFLKITDRKKEMFKTSGGKYVAPQMMENKFKESGFIEQIMVIGEGQKHPAALVVPAYSYVREWATRKGIKIGSSREDMVNNPEVIKRISEEIEKYNLQFGKTERVKKFELLIDEWTIETGELTPTLKLKRRVIKEKFKTYFEKIYGKEHQ